MDSIDKKIIAQIQVNGRISLTELCEKVNLSLSACQRRLKNLENKKIIKAYRADIDPNLVGFNFFSIIFVILKDVSKLADFEKALIKIPEIIQAQRLFGDTDYMLQVVSSDIHAFQELYDKRLSQLPNVQKMTSTLIMKEIVKRGLPI